MNFKRQRKVSTTDDAQQRKARERPITVEIYAIHFHLLETP